MGGGPVTRCRSVGHGRALRGCVYRCPCPQPRGVRAGCGPDAPAPAGGCRGVAGWWLIDCDGTGGHHSGCGEPRHPKPSHHAGCGRQAAQSQAACRQAAAAGRAHHPYNRNGQGRFRGIRSGHGRPLGAVRSEDACPCHLYPPRPDPVVTDPVDRQRQHQHFVDGDRRPGVTIRGPAFRRAADARIAARGALPARPVACRRSRDARRTDAGRRVVWAGLRLCRRRYHHRSRPCGRRAQPH